jgi:hypothetical protein
MIANGKHHPAILPGDWPFQLLIGNHRRIYAAVPAAARIGKATGQRPHQVREEVEIIAHACGLTDTTGFQPPHVTDIERGVGGFRAPQAGK